MIIEDMVAKLTDDDASKIEDCLFFYGFVRSLSPEVCLEVGTHRGVMALSIAKALKDNGHGHLHTCDPIDLNQQDNFNAYPDLAPLITYERKQGQDMEVDKIDFLFIDGYHEKKWVEAEIKALFPRLSKQAVVLFHDCGGDNEYVGVNEAVLQSGYSTILLPTRTRMRIYSNFVL
jgi:predicted O-methyltransferase YrrM